MADGARAEAVRDCQGQVERGGAGNGVDADHAGAAKGDDGAEIIDRAQVVPIEGRTQQGKPGAVGGVTEQCVAVDRVTIQIGEGGGDGSCRACCDVLAFGCEQDDRRPIRGDADRARRIRHNALDPRRGEGSVRFARRWDDAGAVQMMMGADQRDESLRRPQPPAGKPRRQNRQRPLRLAERPGKLCEASRDGLGGEEQRVGPCGGKPSALIPAPRRRS